MPLEAEEAQQPRTSCVASASGRTEPSVALGASPMVSTSAAIPRR